MPKGGTEFEEDEVLLQDGLKFQIEKINYNHEIYSEGKDIKAIQVYLRFVKDD